MKHISLIETPAELVQTAKDDLLPPGATLVIANDLSSCRLAQAGIYQLDSSITTKDLIAFVAQKAKIKLVFM